MRWEVDTDAVLGGVHEIEGREPRKADGGIASLSKFTLIYSLRSELLVSDMDVSRTKIHLDTSISATSNSERRE